MERRLAAILAIDVVGYSRLMGEDEAGTHAALKTHRAELIDPKAAQYHGRIIKLTGDGALMEFPSVVEAVCFAVEVQLAMRKRNAELPEERLILFRIGINIGDIIVEDDDIYGDGVNIAARLESQAESGGICVARNVFNQVKGKLDLNFEHLGEKEVKNIAEPVSIYRVLVDDTAAKLATPVRWMATGQSSRWPLLATAAIVLVVLVGGVAWLRPWVLDVPPASKAAAALPLPDRPSIAVLPFINMSDDPKQEYFVDGVTEDLTTDLSKLAGLFVVARNSTFTYKGKPVMARQVAEELGVRYVLEGSVRRADDQIRINAQLVDGTSGGHMWAERYDASMTDIFAMQDKVTQKVVRAIAVHLAGAGWQKRKETDDPKAYDAFLRGRAYFDLSTPADYAKALSYFEKAIQLDPNYARAHAWLAAMYWNVWNEDWQASMGMTADEAMEKLEHHLEESMKDPTPMAHHVASALLATQGRYDEAIAESERAIALDPNAAIGYKGLGRVLNKAGRPAKGLEVIKKASRLDPRGDDGGDDSYRIGESLFLLAKYDEAVEMFLRYINRSGDEEWGSLLLAANYGQLGRETEAKAAVAKFDEIRAKRGLRPYTLAEFDDWPFTPTVREHYREGLRKAGMRPGAPSSPLLAGVNVAPTAVDGATTIDAARARALLNQGVPFVDVRGKDPEWNSGHIPGAVHLHMYHDFSEKRLSEVVSKDQEVVLYGSGLRSRESGAASARAVSWNFKNVYFFREGFPSWQEAGYPVEVSSK